MSRLFVSNFDFEHQLREGDGFTLPLHLWRRNVEMSFLWLALAYDGDAIEIDAEVDAGFCESMQQKGLARVQVFSSRERIPGGMELCPWGWSRTVQRWGSQRDCLMHAPDENAVVRVNSRRFSFAHERARGLALPAAEEFVELDSLRQHLHDVCRPETRWVIKAEFGMSARERILGTGPFVSAGDVNWMSRRLARGQRLYYEPWVEKVVEAGLQYSIPASGEPQFIGCTELLTDGRGQYRGSRWNERRHVAWESEIETGMQLVREVQHAGYFGPLGIDSMKYRDDTGEIRSRPIQDINARWTMGRMACECRRFVPSGQCYSLLHVAAPDDPSTLSVSDVIRLLPDHLTWHEGRRERLKQQIYLLWAESEEVLAAKEKVIVNNGTAAIHYE